MSAQGRPVDHWSTSLDALDGLRERMRRDPLHEDPEARRVMAELAVAKASTFIVLLDGDGGVLDANPAALIAGGADRSEVVGLPLWRAPWWASSAGATRIALEEAMAIAAEGRIARLDVEVRLGAGATVGTLDFSLRPLRGRDGRVSAIVGEGRQITDRKRAEDRIALQNAELSQLTERLGRVHDFRERLLGELSHDLRVPLKVVIARAEQALLLDPSEEVSLHLSGIRLAALGALEQVEDMLQQVRGDHGETRLTLVDADLAGVVRRVTDQFATLAEERRIALTVAAPERLEARFDVERVSRIASNLLANAIRHAPEAGRVRCSLIQEGGTVRLEVADSGPGVPAEHRDAVFGRFRSGLAGDGRSHGAGAGLGLAIVREFVELHGGEVALEDAPEGGALFVVTLPVRSDAGGDLRAAPATLAQHAAAAQRTEYVRASLEAELRGEAASSVPTVLVVERAPNRADRIAADIGGCAVTCVAGGGRDAIHLAAALRPDAIVVGTAPGEITALALLRRLAADPKLSGARRIALVGDREQDPGEAALFAAGADVVVPVKGPGDLGGRVAAELGAGRD